MPEAQPHISAPDITLTGYDLIMVRCRRCHRPYMEVSDNADGVIIKFKCKSCQTWNTIQFYYSDKRGGNELKIKAVRDNTSPRDQAQQS